MLEALKVKHIDSPALLAIQLGHDIATKPTGYGRIGLRMEARRNQIMR